MDDKVTIISPDFGAKNYLQGIVVHRNTLWLLVHREVLSRYRQTTFGILWAVLQPLSMMIILTLVYKGSIPTGNNKVPYPVFVLSGLLPWQLFARTIETSALSLLQHRHLLTKLYLPRILIPLSNSIVGMLDAGFGILILAIVMVLYDVNPTIRFLLLPAIMFYSLYCALGIGMIVALLNVKYRDVQYIIPFLVRLGFFLTPVSYPSTVFPHKWLLVFYLNPLVGALDLVRWSVVGSEICWAGVVMSLLVSTSCCLYAVHLFQKLEYEIADIM